MLKFVKHHMETITGIDIYPLISLVIFFIFFVALIIYVMRASKNKIDEVAAMPLDTDSLASNYNSHE